MKKTPIPIPRAPTNTPLQTARFSIYLKQNEKAYEFNVKIAVKNKVATIKDGTYAIEQNDESDIDDLFNDVLEAVNELMHKKIEAAHKAAEKAKKKA